MRRQIVIMLLGLMTTLSLPAFAIAGSRESNHATQPYKYIGKELDRTHGLDWYEHGARHYDPLQEGGTPWTRCARSTTMCRPTHRVGMTPQMRLTRMGNKLDRKEKKK